MHAPWSPGLSEKDLQELPGSGPCDGNSECECEGLGQHVPHCYANDERDPTPRAEVVQAEIFNVCVEARPVPDRKSRRTAVPDLLSVNGCR